MAALLMATACSGPAPRQPAPPPSTYAEAPPPALLGAPPAADNTGLLGGPAPAPKPVELGPAPTSDPKYLMRLVTYRRADGVLVTAMRPVPNPEDLEAGERTAIYGHRYAPRAFMTKTGHAAAPVQAAAPAAPVAPAPVTAAKPNPKIEALKNAIGPMVSSGAAFVTPEALKAGDQGTVKLSLPDSLFAAIQRQAAKLGLGKAARKAEVTATLTGQGYEITPPGPQKAELKAGQPAAFTWTVKSLSGPKGPLRAQIDAALTGVKLPFTFSLASLEQAVRELIPPPPPKKTWMDSLPGIPGVKTVSLPGLGVVSSKAVVAGALLLAVLLILVAMARAAGGARSAQRRGRAFAPETAPQPVERTFDDRAHGQHDLAAPVAAAAAAAVVAHAEAADPVCEIPAPAAEPQAPVEAVAEPALVEAQAAELPPEAALGAQTEDDYGLSDVIREREAAIAADIVAQAHGDAPEARELGAHMAAPEIAVEAAPVFAASQQVEAVPTVEATPSLEAEPAAEPEPALEAELAAAPAPDAEAEPAVEASADVGPVPEAAPQDVALEAEAAVAHEPAPAQDENRVPEPA